MWGGCKEKEARLRGSNPNPSPRALTKACIHGARGREQGRRGAEHACLCQHKSGSHHITGLSVTALPGLCQDPAHTLAVRRNVQAGSPHLKLDMNRPPNIHGQWPNGEQCALSTPEKLWARHQLETASIWANPTPSPLPPSGTTGAETLRTCAPRPALWPPAQHPTPGQKTGT